MSFCVLKINWIELVRRESLKKQISIVRARALQFQVFRKIHGGLPEKADVPT